MIGSKPFARPFARSIARRATAEAFSVTNSLFIIVSDWSGLADGTLFAQVVSMFGKSNVVMNVEDQVRRASR